MAESKFCAMPRITLQLLMHSHAMSRHDLRYIVSLVWLRRKPHQASDADDEALEDLYLNVFPPDLENFTDDDPVDLKEVEKDDLGIERETEDEEK